ncbi:hypothetical protein GIB67_015656 [Kingdonia uniflora]|uniref:Uncharacterized protein n=1 Tax=Kingdonia uniflora TaxID=39325 RepID=A0A7J7NUR1_9MAGN|nr:hypothetical protein GIB67_015656 [Kingdonia uniflora]
MEEKDALRMEIRIQLTLHSRKDEPSVDEQLVNVKTDHLRPHALSWENNTTTDAPPVVDSSLVIVTSKDTRKVSHKDATLVRESFAIYYLNISAAKPILVFQFLTELWKVFVGPQFD